MSSKKKLDSRPMLPVTMITPNVASNRPEMTVIGVR